MAHEGPGVDSSYHVQTSISVGRGIIEALVYVVYIYMYMYISIYKGEVYFFFNVYI
jgi:hypothetical protein